ncbi:MAG: hypothetical protein COA62_11885 [Rhodobiaceae bacterium]|nr:MAG: hypothetical protein COA62_11885 [Rhodobiaceae bacterium]
MSENSARGLRIMLAREAAEMTQEQLAEKVSEAKRARTPAAAVISHSAVENWELGLGFTTETLRGLSDALNVTREWILYGSDESTEIEPQYLRVLGCAQPGTWLEEIDQPSDEVIPAVPDPRYRGKSQYALKMVGPSMNSFIKDGSYAFCVDWDDLDIDLATGQFVVVRRCRAGLFETTIKQVEIDGKGSVILTPKSDDPKFRTPLEVDAGLEVGREDTKVIIAALVVGHTELFY